jgi:hypothetical protein|tara:strand:- start:276 stop:575 length:300 start_codon:yes stop_codon:yes gene_type:complete
MVVRELLQVSENMVWTRGGGQQVRKYRCTSGIRKGRTMASPASCNKPLNVAKSQTLKKTKAAKGNNIKATSFRTRKQNPRSIRLKTINKPTNKSRGGRM